MTKFIILSTGRTGSNLLTFSLRESPEIICYQEIFNKTQKLPETKALLKEAYGSGAADSFQCDMSPVRLLDYIFFEKEYPPEVKAVGFKIFYNHPYCRDAGIRERIWNYLKNIEGLKIIHLRRLNYLDSLISKEIALKTGKWLETGPAKKGQPGKVKQSNISVEIAPGKAREYFSRLDESIQTFENLLKEWDTLELKYRQLSEDLNQAIFQVTTFLNLDSPVFKKAVIKKQSSGPRYARARNYFELRQVFKGTAWEKFFDEDFQPTAAKAEKILTLPGGPLCPKIHFLGEGNRVRVEIGFKLRRVPERDAVLMLESATGATLMVDTTIGPRYFRKSRVFTTLRPITIEAIFTYQRIRLFREVAKGARFILVENSKNKATVLPVCEEFLKKCGGLSGTGS